MTKNKKKKRGAGLKMNTEKRERGGEGERAEELGEERKKSV